MFINLLNVAKTKLDPRARPVKTPTVLQMEAVECGAAALGMILGYYGKYVPLAELRQTCGVSRDGVTAANILRAARSYGMIAKGFKKNLERVRQLQPPYIVFWHFNHFLVVDGFEQQRVYLNNPAVGPVTVSVQEFDEGYTGVVLVIEPGPEFQPGGQKPSVVPSLRDRLRTSTGALLYCVLAGFLLVIPNLALPVFTQVFIDGVLTSGNQNWLPYIILASLLAVALQGGLTLLQLRYLRSLKIKLAVSASSRFVWHLLHLPTTFYAQRYAGEISSRVRLNDEVADVLSGRLTTTVISAVLVVFYAIAMFQYDVILPLIVICFAAINVFTLQWVSRQRTDANLRLAQEYGKASGVAIAGLQSMETLKASGLESDFFARWAGYYTKAMNAQQELGIISKTLGVLPALLTALTAVSLLTIGGLRVINGTLTIGMLVAFQLLTQSFLLPVNRLVQFGSTIQDLQGNVQRLDDVLNNEIDPQLKSIQPSQIGCEQGVWGHCPHAGGAPLHPLPILQRMADEQILEKSDWRMTSATPNHRLQGYITLKNITYGYSPLEAPLIENFNLDVKPGQRIALVGGSGSGKSTIARIVAGLFEPWSGEICFDGLPRHQIPRPILTNSIAMVEQEILLFAGSVRDNLTLWDSTVPTLAVERACEDAAIADVILAMSGGYDAQLLEGATNLSGGQRQRLEIARSLINDPAILIMDEATSALDSESERAIDLKLRQRGCTCLIVAHRLSTIRDCDEIIVLERGRAVQRGTHDELWQQSGSYAQLIRSEES